MPLTANGPDDSTGHAAQSTADTPPDALSDAATAALAEVLTSVDVAGWATRFELISDPTRLKLLLCLHFSPNITVTGLAVASGVSQTVVSQSLRRLRDREWVAATKVGRQHHYRIVDDSLHGLLHAIGAPHSDRSERHR